MGRTVIRLEDVGVLVTRPEQQAAQVSKLLADAGARVLRFPALAIEFVDQGAELDQALAVMERQHLLVFTSANAVTGWQKLLARDARPLPVDVPCAAIGRRTGELLRQIGMRNLAVAPPPYDSEALLAQSVMQQVAGRRAMLVTGEGGRGLLQSTLRDRGAEITELVVYRRVLPSADPTPLQQWLAEGCVDVALVTSAEALQNLLVLSGETQREALLATDLVTVSARIAETAKQRGFHGAIIETEPGDTALVQGVVRWCQQAEKRATDD